MKTAAWAAAGAALFGGGMFLGLVSALVGRKYPPAAGAAPGGESPGPAREPVSSRRIEELALAVADLEKRVEAAAAPLPVAVADKVDVVSFRVERLERRVEQLVRESSSMPPIDQVLAAVEHMVAAKIGGLDERLTDQVHAIELLRSASAETDALLQRLINAVEALAAQTSERAQEPPAREAGRAEPAAGPFNEGDYPIA